MTLIELFAVIAIFSIIMALTMGAAFSVKAHSADVYCITALKEIGSALRQYRIDYGAYPPPLRVEEYGYYNAATGEGRRWNDPPPPGPGWASPSAHQGPPLFYYPPEYPEGIPSEALKYAGAVPSLVEVRLLNRPAVCRNDLSRGEGREVSGYSTYSILYNYWGYDGPYVDWQGIYQNIKPSGKPYRHWWEANSPSGQLKTVAPLPDRDEGPAVVPDQLPIGIPSWDVYPRLANPDAPDTTIVTRCPHHRQGVKARSNVLWLAGNVVTVRDDEWLNSDTVGIPFQYQPEKPGSP